GFSLTRLYMPGFSPRAFTVPLSYGFIIAFIASKMTTISGWPADLSEYLISFFLLLPCPALPAPAAAFPCFAAFAGGFPAVDILVYFILKIERFRRGCKL